jgi:ribosomal protein S18 acetylase RimI-like enzyme
VSVVQELKVRKAEFRDADAIAGVHERARREAMPWLPVVHTALQTRGFVRELLKKEDVYVAVDAGKVVGYGAWRGGRLNHLYVHPSAQRRGVGTLLLSHARRAMPAGFKFWVFQRNAIARAFYEKHGCVAQRETDGRSNAEREPDVEYAWRP